MVSELDAVLTKIDRTSRLIAKENTAMDSDDIDIATIKVLAGRVAKADAELSTLTAQKDALQSKVDAERAKCEAIYTPERLLELLKSTSPEGFEIRTRLKLEISQRISRIEISFKDQKPDLAVVTWINDFKSFVLFQLS